MVNGELKDFLTEVNAWKTDPYYFAKNTDIDYVPVYYWRRLCFGGWRETFHNYYFSTSFCFWIPELISFHPILVPVNKSAEARQFAGQYSLDDGRIDPDVALGSQQAKNLSRILEDMLGVEFFDGKLEQTCTGTLSYDTDSTIPCDSPTLLGRILLGLIDTIIPPARSQDVTPVFTQLPEPSPGLYGYGGNFPPEDGGGTYRRGQFGTTETIESVKELGERWKEKYPNGPPIGVGDISRQGGAAWPKKPDGDPWHDEHLEGKHVDIRPMRKDEANSPVDYRNAQEYDRERTQELLNEIEKDDNVCGIIFNDPQITSERITIESDPSTHNNHLHIEYCE